MAVIGGFRSDLSITCMIDGNFGNVSRVFCFRKSRINENGGNDLKFLFGLLEKRFSENFNIVLKQSLRILSYNILISFDYLSH